MSMISMPVMRRVFVMRKFSLYSLAGIGGLHDHLLGFRISCECGLDAGHV